MKRAWLIGLFGLGACTSGAKEDGFVAGPGDDTDAATGEAPGGGGPGGGDDDGAPCGALGNLEVVPLDIWGRDLSGAALTLGQEPNFVDDPDVGPGVVIVRYGGAAVDLSISWRADDHTESSFVASYDGSGGFSFSTPGEGRLAASGGERLVDGVSCPITTVYVGLDHTWFAATGRAPSLNRVELAMDGEEQWSGVSEDLKRAQDRISLSTWWWQSDFELIRQPRNYTLSENARWANTAMGHLEDLPRTERRLLINRFWDENSDWSQYLNTDSELREYANDLNDDFEVVLQGNPTEVPLTSEYVGEAADFDFGARVLTNPRYADRAIALTPILQPAAASVQVASYHQKFLVIDGEVAWVSGMNVKSTDWDTNEHLIFEPGRMDFDADASEREDVADRLEEPDYGPRKDYGIRVEGPAARDAEEVFWERWEAAIDGDDLYADRATRFDLSAAPAEPSGGVPTQILATMPEPWADMSIQESHAKAILAAREYIYIEDQYFRAPLMNQHLIDVMDANPDLVLIVVTKDVSDYDGGAKYTYLSDVTFRERYPSRYLLLQLRTSELLVEEDLIWDDVEVITQNVDTHSKIRIIDDRYLSVGSCNFNNRGYKYEGELDVSVLDGDTAASARRRVFENLVGPEWDHLLSNDARNNFDVLAMAAEDNTAALAWWDANADDLDADEAERQWNSYRPSGFVYPLEISSQYQFDVGPDAF